MKSSTLSRNFFLIFVIVNFLIACSPPSSDVQIIETDAKEEIITETVYINNCGGMANTVQTATRSFSTSLGGGVTAKLQIKLIAEGGVSAKYEEARNTIKSIQLAAPPGTNMEFTLQWTEQTWIGRILTNGESGDYIARMPISVAQVSAIDLRCPSGSSVTPNNPGNSSEITIWHAFGTGSAEEAALSTILRQAAIDLPNIKINAVQVPFGDIYNKYRTDVAAGGGPDMYLVPNDSLGDDARAGLLADITNLASGKLGDYSQLGINGMMVNGRLYGIPESQKAVVFWYNKDLLSSPPATTDDLMNLMKGGTPISVSFGCYHHYGFFGAFGGRIFDDNWNFIANQGSGVTNAMNYLDELYQIAKVNGWPKTDADGLSPFTEGKMAGITNGNWAMGDYRNALGGKLGVAPLPSGPGGPANPMLGIDGFYFNPNSQNIEIAIQVALYLTNKQSQTIMMNEAGHVPVNNTVTITDPLIQGLSSAFKNGYVRPQDAQLAKYWSNFCGTDQVFEAGVPATTWVQEANTNANK